MNRIGDQQAAYLSTWLSEVFINPGLRWVFFHKFLPTLRHSSRISAR
jgi:hypothetical protein